jgi:hypothetical protein
VYNEQPLVLIFFWKKGAQLECRYSAGNTALMGVCFKGYKEIAR